MNILWWNPHKTDQSSTRQFFGWPRLAYGKCIALSHQRPMSWNDQKEPSPYWGLFKKFKFEFPNSGLFCLICLQDAACSSRTWMWELWRWTQIITKWSAQSSWSSREIPWWSLSPLSKMGQTHTHTWFVCSSSLDLVQFCLHLFCYLCQTVDGFWVHECVWPGVPAIPEHLNVLKPIR